LASFQLAIAFEVEVTAPPFPLVALAEVSRVPRVVLLLPLLLLPLLFLVLLLLLPPLLLLRVLSMLFTNSEWRGAVMMGGSKKSSPSGKLPSSLRCLRRQARSSFSFGGKCTLHDEIRRPERGNQESILFSKLNNNLAG
jgi:hypothetical protein